MLVAPWRKHLTFTFGSNIGSSDLHDIRDAKPLELANLPCGLILVREPPTDELVVLSTGRVGKNRNSCRNAASYEVRRFERPRAAGIGRYDEMSAVVTGSLTTSAQPATRRIGSRREGTVMIVTAANAVASSIRAHLHRELMLVCVSKFPLGI
jgi:hypothetical protein